jgi:hypothetical protein
MRGRLATCPTEVISPNIRCQNIHEIDQLNYSKVLVVVVKSINEMVFYQYLGMNS